MQQKRLRRNENLCLWREDKIEDHRGWVMHVSRIKKQDRRY